MSVTSCTDDSHSFTAEPSWVQPPCSEGVFPPCTLSPAWLGCVNEVDSEWSVRNANTVSYQYIPECPTDCAASSFLSSSPECNLCLVIQWKSFALKKQSKQAASALLAALKLADRRRVVRFTSTSFVTWRQPRQETSEQSDNSSLLWPSSFLSFNWVHVNECPVTSLL